MSWEPLVTPEAIRRSVQIYRDPKTTETTRDSIRLTWSEVGIATQFAAMMRAAEIERAAQ